MNWPIQNKRGRRLFPWSNVSSLDVLVAVALDFVFPFFLVETNLGSSHDLSGALALGVERYLKKTEGVIGAAATVVEFPETHAAGGNDSNDGVRTVLALAGDGDLIASGTDGVDAALIFLFQSASKSVGPFFFEKLCEILDFFIGGVLWAIRKSNWILFPPTLPPVPMATPEKASEGVLS
jgi:hypothetical protein